MARPRPAAAGARRRAADRAGQRGQLLAHCVDLALQAGLGLAGGRAFLLGRRGFAARLVAFAGGRRHALGQELRFLGCVLAVFLVPLGVGLELRLGAHQVAVRLVECGAQLVDVAGEEVDVGLQVERLVRGAIGAGL